MGLEAQCQCTVGGQTHAVRAHLESVALVLRGATLRRNIAIPAITDARVEKGVLFVNADGEALGLALGTLALKWLTKITTPPPTLAAKLQISTAAPAYIWGTVDDCVLQAAFAGATTREPLQAHVLVAFFLQGVDPQAVLFLHSPLPRPAPWVGCPQR